MELDGDKCSLSYVPTGTTRNKSNNSTSILTLATCCVMRFSAASEVQLEDTSAVDEHKPPRSTRFTTTEYEAW